MKGRVLSTLRSHGRDVRVNDLGEFCHVSLFTQRSVYVSVCRHTYVCSYAHTYIYRSGLCPPGFSAVRPWIWASAPTPSPPFLATVEILLCSWVSVYLALASLGFNPHRGATERPVPSVEVLPDLGRLDFVFLGCFMLYQGLGFWQSGNLLCFVSAD